MATPCSFTDQLKHKIVNKTTCRMSTANPHINYRAFQLLQFFIFFGEVFPGVPDLFNKELLGNLKFSIKYVCVNTVNKKDLNGYSF